ncbi:hypothetical protein [Aliikangiella sp. G2MR2-5]|uniref:hypothetical protein n=1 Tax=Aliikangiella sp. G2MR2-5 TaxID=2788943 RepID=UPI0018ABADA9|nr:hypothetical protein [Aliikangiella sp. G2MR2-5]
MRFSTTYFEVYPYEDDEVNPGILGKSLCKWVKEQLLGTRFEVTETIAEDFGYCLMIHRKPYWLWVGCQGLSDFNYPENGLSEDIATKFPLDQIEWNLWVATEMGWLNRLLRRDNRKTDRQDLLKLLEDRLLSIGVINI